MATTGAQIIARVRSRADLGAASSSPEDDFVTNDEILSWANLSAAKLWKRLVKIGLIVPRATVDITATGLTDYPLGNVSLIYSILKVCYVVSPGQYWPLRRHGQRTTPSTGVTPAYGVSGTYLVFQDEEGNYRIELGDPPPTSGTYRIWYTPEYTPMVALTDAIHFPYGWDEIVVLETVAKARGKGDEVLTNDEVRELKELNDMISSEGDAQEQGDGHVIENVDDPNRGLAWRRGGWW